jgi:23S rRNA pseudouridine1911/1915/1917 synthase
VASSAGYYLVEVRPVTGRPHQIRVQLAAIGCVICGDLKYGDSEAAEDARIYLHARKLGFIHPVQKKRVSFEAPVPAVGLWKYFLKFEKKVADE